MAVPIPPQPPIEPCLVYLDTCALVDIADVARVRHGDAIQLLSLFQRHQHNGVLWLATSRWAITECHGVLYDTELQRSRIRPPRRGGRPRPLRDIVPPNATALAAATQTKNNLLQILTSTTDFLLLPDAVDATPMWQLTMRIAEEAGIYAPDSIHVATALENGDCKILVSDDQDLLDKIDSCQASLIQPYRQQQFSMLPAAPPFNAYGIQRSRSNLPGHHRRLTAEQALNALGFN